MDLRKRIFFDIYRRYRHNQARLHPLTYLFWECTLRCNLNCMHCGSDCSKEMQVPEMPLEDFLAVLDLIRPHVDPPNTTVVLTGGEPTLRKDLCEAGRQFSQRGFPWGMVSNGFALNENLFSRLMKSGLRSLTISLDGLQENHDRFRGCQGSFERALKAILLGSAAEGLTFDVATCVYQRNLNELPSLRDLLIDAGLKRWRIFVVFPKGRAKDNPELSLDDTQFRAVYDFIAETRNSGKIRVNSGCEGFLGDYELQARDYPFFCRAGINIGSVLADGSISACPSLRADYIQGNIYRDDFWEVWENRFQIMRDRSWTRSGKCAKCKVYKWCEGNGLHLRDENTGALLQCHYERLMRPESSKSV
ncbi:MAG: TIGR04133 family radical SAM/SPASM protein [Candidatus Neomarinimicrobiota bacterium]|jgi:radical SAM enzyme (rSAM/lipoprotein system)|nr:TIGR04133 family radical SAM/SPASM protein [Candidatus Neomarinimicrobiota bacterium]MDD3966922.1 TIGR04133 family radical SAM/SPASM protein [Candidatus Neomarinimicrobiota bacterium]MDX9779944.1 TIGR04133 family radical SAM/SPASM protein [bacterium]